MHHLLIWVLAGTRSELKGRGGLRPWPSVAHHYPSIVAMSACIGLTPMAVMVKCKFTYVSVKIISTKLYCLLPTNLVEQHHEDSRWLSIYDCILLCFCTFIPFITFTQAPGKHTPAPYPLPLHSLHAHFVMNALMPNHWSHSLDSGLRGLRRCQGNVHHLLIWILARTRSEMNGRGCLRR